MEKLTTEQKEDIIMVLLDREIESNKDEINRFEKIKEKLLFKQRGKNKMTSGNDLVEHQESCEKCQILEDLKDTLTEHKIRILDEETIDIEHEIEHLRQEIEHLQLNCFNEEKR